MGPAELRVERGTLTTGPYEAASAIDGTIDCKVDDFDTEPVFGMEPFRFISARARLNLQVPGLDPVNFLAAPGGKVELEDGSGELAMDVAIDHGVMTPDTWLAYRTGHLGVATPFAKFRLDGELGMSAFGPRESGPPEVIVALPTATLSFDGARHPPIVIHDTGGALATSTVDVTQPWTFAGASANVVAQGVKLCQKDCICAETPRFSLSASATSLARERAPETSFRNVTRPIDARVRGTIDRPSFRWGSFRLTGARTSFATVWDGSLASSFIRMTGLKLVSSGGAPKGWQANIGSVSLRSDLRASSDGVGGPLWLDVGGIDARVGKTRLEGSATARLELRSKDPSDRTGDLSGVVQARRVAVHAGNQEVRDWWADLALRKLHVDTRENVDFTGTVGARFRDALPALDALASEDQVPGWVPKAFPLRSLAVDLEVERFCKFTDVQLINASGGPLKASGRLQFEPGETRGALLFELAAFHPASLGLDFVEDYSHTKVFAGSRWLEEHMEPLTKAAREKHDTRCEPEPTTCE